MTLVLLGEKLGESEMMGMAELGGGVWLSSSSCMTVSCCVGGGEITACLVNVLVLVKEGCAGLGSGTIFSSGKERWMLLLLLLLLLFSLPCFFF